MTKSEHEKLKKIHSALDRELGDTDPYITNDMTDADIEMEYPLFWAAKEIASMTYRPKKKKRK